MIFVGLKHAYTGERHIRGLKNSEIVLEYTIHIYKEGVMNILEDFIV